MEKLNLKTKDLNQENILKLTELFPELLTEVEKDGELVKTIDVTKLKKLVGDFADSSDEVYELTWAGKNKSRQKIVKPINKTLRPVPEDSVDFENTENLYIEGDNFEVLKLLQESYLNKVKMIYIDPPYNTGKDFVYKDNFSMSKEDYDSETGAVDEEGNKLFKNTTTNGRFHSDWLSMMYERLVIAKDLLRDDGVIFISIDDNEVDNLRKVCDEIFGENHVDTMVWRKSGDGRDGKMKNTETFRKDHEYVVVCFKDVQKLNKIIEKPNFKGDYSNADNDPRGDWLSGSISRSDEASNPESDKYYTVISPTGKKTTRQFEIHKEEFDKLDADKRISWGSTGDAVPRIKTFINEDRSITAYSILLTKGTTTEGKEELRKLFEINDKKDIFDNPKPTELMRTLTQLGTEKDSLVLDFFAGSSSLAHGLLLQNAKDEGNRKFIMVQLNENLDDNLKVADKFSKDTIENSVGFLDSINKPHLLTEIGKERIRRAAKKIKEDNKDKDLSKIDFGFRVFKLDSSNMKDVYYNPKEIDQRTLKNFKDNIKDDRTDKDLLYQVLLELAIPISAKVKEEKVNKKTIYRVNENFLIACFEENVDLETIKQIAELKPLRIVFKDSSFKDDATKVNCDEYLKNKLPNTSVKVI
jgi:adenine-specific DNA-methyltransferase